MLLGLIFLILIIAYIYRWRKMVKKLPPGPWPLPFIGNVFQISSKDSRRTFSEWRETYGPVYTVWLGSRPFVFVCNYETMQESFIKQGDLYADRAPNWIFSHVYKGNNGIVTANGEQWKEQRRFTLQTLRNFGFGKKLMEEKVMEEVKRLLDGVETSRRQTVNCNVDIDADLQSCVGNIISSVLMGTTYSKSDPTFRRLKSALDSLLKLVTELRLIFLMAFSWLKYVPLFGRFGFDDFQVHNRVIFDILLKELAKHKNEIKLDEEASDFTAAYLQEIERKRRCGDDVSYFSEWQLVCVLYDLWFAGMETTVTTMLWAFLLMIRYPDVQRRVQKEIDSIVGRERLPNMTDKNKMPYTQAVLNEIQRYANILAANFPRLVSQEGVVIGGHTIPVGTSVVPQISVCALDKRAFADPSAFDPNHYLENDGVSLKKVDEFQPFSVGKRMCLGEGLARMELFLIFTSVLQRYSLSVPKGQATPTLQPVVRVTMTTHPYSCHVEERI